MSKDFAQWQVIFPRPHPINGNKVCLMQPRGWPNSTTFAAYYSLSSAMIIRTFVALGIQDIDVVGVGMMYGNSDLFYLEDGAWLNPTSKTK